MTAGRRVLAGLVLVVLVLGGGAPPAAAHATLTSVDPADGARLDESPDVVRLTFSEPVSTGLGGVRVLDADGAPVQQGAARVDEKVVTVQLQPNLSDGTYVVTYRVISADGHPVRGGSVFGVGEEEVDPAALGRAASSGDDRGWEVVGAVGRALAYAGGLLAAGGVAFLVLVYHRGDDWAALVRMVRGAALVGGLGALVALPVQAALGTGQGARSLLDDGVLSEVARDGVGLGLVLALVGLVVATGLVGRARWLALAGSLVAAASFAANGHTRAGDRAVLATVADASHLVVAAVWGGGIVLLLVVLRRRKAAGAGASASAELVARFSAVATASVLGVAASGGALAWREVRTLDGLTGTGYGRLLLAKVAVVAVVAGLGAYNHFRLVPALQAGKGRAATAQLRRTLRVEALALLLVLALTSVLVVVTPARTLAAGGVVERVVALGEHGSVQVTVAPARAGFNQIHLYLFDVDGRPADIAESVTLALSLPEADLGPITREAARAGPAHLQVDGRDLAVSGRWTVQVNARIDRFTEASGAVEIPVAA